MMPDAMPALSGGTAVIASDVMGVRHSAQPSATSIRPMTTATTEPSSVTIMMTSPAISDDSPKRIGARVPALATKRPTMHDTIAIVALYGSSSKPVSTGEYARTFCRYCVVTRSIP